MYKRIFKVLVLVLTFVMVFGSAVCCAAAPQLADMIVIGRGGDAAYLDPNEAVGINEVGITQQIYQTLVANNKESTAIIPCLATKWDISEDGMTYVFTLREGVKFSDGSEITAEDWEWSIERTKTCETSAYRFVLDALESWKSDGKTLTLKLAYPSSSFLASLTCFNVVLGKKSHFDKIGAEEYAANPIGTGPYMLKEWLREEHILLEANPHYWEEGYPKTRYIKFVIIPDDNTRMLQLQSGQIDVMSDVPFTLINPLKSDRNVTVLAFPSTQVRFYIMNSLQEPFTNVKVRQAVIQAIDKQAISDLVAGQYGAVANAHVPEAEGKWWHKDLKTVPHDVAASKKLLAEAGHPNGIEFTCLVRAGAQVYEQIATLMKSQLAEAGITMNIELMERASLSDKYQTLNHQATVLQWLDDILDPSGVVGFAVDYSQSNGWYTGIDDPVTYDLFQRANRELDEAKRVVMYHEIQQRLYDAFAIVPLFRNSFVWAARNNVQGVLVTPFNVQICQEMTKTK